MTFVWLWRIFWPCERVSLKKYILFYTSKETVFLIKRYQEVWFYSRDISKKETERVGKRERRVRQRERRRERERKRESVCSSTYYHHWRPCPRHYFRHRRHGHNILITGGTQKKANSFFFPLFSSTTSEPGLPVGNCAGSSNNLVPRGTKVSAINVTATALFERLYSVLALNPFEPRVNCPHAPTPPLLTQQLFLYFRAIFFPSGPSFFVSTRFTKNSGLVLVPSQRPSPRLSEGTGTPY